MQKASAFSDQGLCMVTVTCGCDGPVLPNQDPSCLAAGGVYGIIRTARIEMPKVKLITIDTDLLALEEDVVEKSYRQVAAQVVHELQCGDDNTEVAYRRGVRWVPKLLLSREAAGPLSHPPSLELENGVTLITGGLGGLGIVTMEAYVNQ